MILSLLNKDFKPFLAAVHFDFLNWSENGNFVKQILKFELFFFRELKTIENKSKNFLNFECLSAFLNLFHIVAP